MRSWPVVMMATLLIGISGCLTKSDASPPTVPEDEGGSVAMAWSSDLQGNLAVEISGDFGTQNYCDVTMALGFAREGPPIQFATWWNGVPRSGLSGGALAGAQVVSEEVPVLLNTRIGGSVETVLNGSVSGVNSLLLLMFGVGPTDTPATEGASIRIDARCMNGADLRLAAGRNVVVFTPAYGLEGTAAADVTTIVGPDVSATLQGGRQDRFAEDRVVFAGLSSVSQPGISGGSLELSHPAGQISWDFTSRAEMFLESGPGDYDVRVTRYGVGLSDFFYGALAGLQPIDSLADIDRLPAFQQT